MKAVILSASTVLAAATAFCLAVAVWLGPTADAQTTQTVKPVVHVVTTYTGALTIGGDVDENGVLDFGYLVAGGEPVTRALSLDVAANAGWQVTVTSTQTLTYATTGDTIPAEGFTFTSSGDPGPTYVTTDTPFRTGDDTGGQVASVVSDGPPSGAFPVDVIYRLEIPVTQAEGYYSAGNHVYTLIVGE